MGPDQGENMPEAAWERIAPLWPLKNLVAANPYFGLRDMGFWEAHRSALPMRLNVVIEAPQDAIEDVIASHAVVDQLVSNSWLHLFRIAEDGTVSRRHADKGWRPLR